MLLERSEGGHPMIYTILAPPFSALTGCRPFRGPAAAPAHAHHQPCGPGVPRSVPPRAGSQWACAAERIAR